MDLVGAAFPSLALDPFAEAFLAGPHAHHALLRDTGPVVTLSHYGVHAMARHAEVAPALKDFATYCSGRGVGLSDFARESPWRPPSLLLESDPPLHTRTRGIMTRIVSPAALKAVEPAWREKAGTLVAKLVARRRFDAITDLAEVYPLTLFPDLIGLPKDGREHLLPYATAVFNAFGPRNAIFERGNCAAADAAHWVADACKRVNLRPGGWGAAVFARVDAGEISEAEAERLVRSLLSAGIDTTISGIGHMLHALATHPAEWDRLRASPTLTRRVFEEVLRWASPVQTFFRTTTTDVSIAGGVIPTGSKVLLFLAAANRDPRRWANAEHFDITRVASGHVAFGFGLHQCLGQMLARLEAELIVEALIEQVSAIRALGEPVVRVNNTLFALAHFAVEVDPE